MAEALCLQNSPEGRVVGLLCRTCSGLVREGYCHGNSRIMAAKVMSAVL
jgi:hypothetical protein